MKYAQFTKKIEQQQGFSLIELLVSVFIFSIVMTISVGSLVVLIGLNDRGQEVQIAVNNLQFALDSMTRSLRTGRQYYCDNTTTGSGALPNNSQDCGGGGARIVFWDNRRSELVGYRLNSSSGIGVIERKIGSGAWLRVTAPNIDISTFTVTVTNSDSLFSGNLFQPTVQFLIKGEVVSNPDSDFILQTTVTQRTLDRV